MDWIRPPQIRRYETASAMEWIETDGVGGVASSSLVNANTRKQHGLLSVDRDSGGRTVLVANLQETVIHGTRTYDLSTNAYFGAIHPTGYLALEAFSADPWPTWRYRFDTLAIEKEIVMVHGEHAVVVRYTLHESDRPAGLVVRPLLAFRDQNSVASARGRFPNNWQVTREFVECKPFEDGPTLYIAHPNAKIETIGFWYQGFVYERDRELHLECIEDLFHSGHLEIPLTPETPCSLVFSSPSPRSVELAAGYIEAERARRDAMTRVPGVAEDPLLAALLKSADTLVYEGLDGRPGIFAGLPWGEAERYRGLMAFAGVLLTRERFDVARDYLRGVAEAWGRMPSPTRFEPETIMGQMHPADVPLWLFVAAWRYWKATNDAAFVEEVLLPVLEEIARHYFRGSEVRCTDAGLIEVGHEPGADYAPILPLGTNGLWYNAQRILAELLQLRSATKARRWQDRAQRTFAGLAEWFSCEGRAGLADGVRRDPFWRDETLRSSQVLAVGLPYCAVEDARPVVALIQEHLYTPLGLRTLSPSDSRYVGDGGDVKQLPKRWSGSVDATWFGCYCDALKRVRGWAPSPGLFAPFEAELHQRGYGHISGAFAGDAPHEPCDYVASSSALGEVLRIYAREALHLAHMA